MRVDSHPGPTATVTAVEKARTSTITIAPLGSVIAAAPLMPHSNRTPYSRWAKTSRAPVSSGNLGKVPAPARPRSPAC